MALSTEPISQALLLRLVSWAELLLLNRFKLIHDPPPLKIPDPVLEAATFFHLSPSRKSWVLYCSFLLPRPPRGEVFSACQRYRWEWVMDSLSLMIYPLGHCKGRAIFALQLWFILLRKIEVISNTEQEEKIKINTS